MLKLVDEGMESIREVTEALRPTILDELGLVPALRVLATRFSDESGLRVIVESWDELPQISDVAELVLYRTIQEALTNAVRHAHAQHVVIVVRTEGEEVVGIVRDNGVGLAPADLLRKGARGRGLAGARERVTALGGRFKVLSPASGGTEILAQVPLLAGDAHA